MEATKELNLTCFNGVKGSIDTTETDTLATLRDKIHKELDDDMIPIPDFGFHVNDRRVSVKQETKKRTWDLITSKVKVSLETKKPRPSSSLSITTTTARRTSMEPTFVEVEEEELALPTNSTFERKKVFSVFRREMGECWNSMVYIRKHLVDFEKTLMKDFWNHQHRSIAYVTGPPGCGKTCFFYLWARLLSVNERKRVLIIQFRTGAICYIWIRETNGTLWRMDQGICTNELLQITLDIIKKNKDKPFDLCIYDVVSNYESIWGAMLSILNTNNTTIKKMIHVTSLPVHLSPGYQILHHLDDTVIQLSVDSWRLEEYTEAITCKEFAEKVRNILINDQRLFEDDGDEDGTKLSSAEASDEVASSDDFLDDGTDIATLTNIIETKYYYAGGSARFMFDVSLSNLRNSYLDDHFNRVPDDNWVHFTKGSISSSSSTAVNTLMQQFGNKVTPVSKYVLIRAYEKCQTKLVRSVQSEAINSSSNPVLKGWAFELEQIDLIRLTLDSPSGKHDYITNNKGLSFTPQSKIIFDGFKFFEYGVAITETGTGVVIWCQEWNQGCFDVAFYQHKTLVTFQFTISKQHSLKPMYIRRLRDALLKKGVSVDRVVHVCVTPKEQEFQFKTETLGTGRKARATEDPQFKIETIHSLPLEKKTASSPVGPEFFESNKKMLESIEM